MDSNTQLSESTKVKLLELFTQHRPIGISRHFVMSIILAKLTSQECEPVTSDQAWTYYRSLYNLDYFDQKVKPSFPIETRDLGKDKVFVKFCKEFNQNHLSSSGEESNGSKSETVKTDLDDTSSGSGRSTPLSTSSAPNKTSSVIKSTPKLIVIPNQRHSTTKDLIDKHESKRKRESSESKTDLKNSIKQRNTEHEDSFASVELGNDRTNNSQIKEETQNSSITPLTPSTGTNSRKRSSNLNVIPSPMVQKLRNNTPRLRESTGNKSTPGKKKAK